MIEFMNEIFEFMHLACFEPLLLFVADAHRACALRILAHVPDTMMAVQRSLHVCRLHGKGSSESLQD